MIKSTFPGNNEIVSKLVNSGAIVQHQDRNCNTAYDLAMLNGNSKEK